MPAIFFLKAFKSTFNPEFLNHIDNVVVFNSPSKDNTYEIILYENINIVMQVLLNASPNLGLAMELTPEAKSFIAGKGYHSQFGARTFHKPIQ